MPKIRNLNFSLRRRVENVLNDYKNGAISLTDARKKLGYLTRRLTSHTKPIDGAVFLTYWSDDAARYHPNITYTNVDHAIPVACIIEDMLYETVKYGGNATAALISLDYGYFLVRVTVDEHKKLSRASMPAGWTEKSNNSWMARYVTAKIRVNLIEKNGKLESI